MNPFILGKLAEIHIQSLFDSANGSRATRRATSRCRDTRPKRHFHWRKKSVQQTPQAEQ
jgi:hypothetical protein